MNSGIAIALGLLFMILYMALSMTFQAFTERVLGVWMYMAAFSAVVSVIIISLVPQIFS